MFSGKVSWDYFGQLKHLKLARSPFVALLAVETISVFSSAVKKDSEGCDTMEDRRSQAAGPIRLSVKVIDPIRVTVHGREKHAKSMPFHPKKALAVAIPTE